jgi:OPA family hexose phosphate transport protein UhpT-like MFS transporter
MLDMGFFDIKRKASANIPLKEQKRRWMPQFAKAFMVVFTAYFASYMIRNNMNVAQVQLKTQLGMTADQFANMILPYSIAYGFGKTLLAFLVDERNSKKIMSFLVLLGGIANMVIGTFYFTNMSLNALIIGTALIWGVNGLVLSPGGPCAYSTIMRWLPKSKQATWLGRWNVSHNLGGAFAAILRPLSKLFSNEFNIFFPEHFVKNARNSTTILALFS